MIITISYMFTWLHHVDNYSTLISGVAISL